MGGREHRRNARLILEKPLHVILGSIGSDVHYDLETKDLSTKGFFLESDQPGRFPFTPSSIIEVWLEIAPDDVVFFNGKISRIIFPEEAETINETAGIAMRIIQIEADEEKRLGEFLAKKLGEMEQVEEGTSVLPPTPPAEPGKNVA